MMLRAIWRLSMPGTFMPNFSVLMSWAESSAALPITTTRPLPRAKASPWTRPAAGVDGPVAEREIHRRVGQLENRGGAVGAFERRAREGLDLGDSLGIDPPSGDRVIAQQVILAAEDQACVAPGGVYRVGRGSRTRCSRPGASPGTGRPPPSARWSVMTSRAPPPESVLRKLNSLTIRRAIKWIIANLTHASLLSVFPS